MLRVEFLQQLALPFALAVFCWFIVGYRGIGSTGESSIVPVDECSGVRSPVTKKDMIICCFLAGAAESASKQNPLKKVGGLRREC